MLMFWRWLLILAAMTLPPSAAEAQERRVALVIGNGAYRQAGALPNATNDAEDVAGVLRGLGFAVTLVRDQEVAAMRQAIRSFGETARGADVALFYYSGHGLQMGQRDRAENFLVPVDARLADARDAPAETIALSGVLDWMEGARARVVILDACRNNPLVARMANASGTRSIGAGLAPLDAAGAQGTLVAFATAPGAVALDGHGRNSPFTAALLRHLPTPGVEIRGAMTRVRADVARATGNTQVPWSNDGLLSELFLAGVAPPTPPPAPAPTVSPEALDLALWQSVQGSRNAADFEEYLRRFPDGLFAGVARNRMAELRPTAAVPPPAATAGAPEPTPLDRQQATVVATALPGATAARPDPSGYPVAVGQSFRDCADCPEMVVIPAGSFVMGSRPTGISDDEPERTVRVAAPLAVGRFPVTVGEYRAFVQATGRADGPTCLIYSGSGLRNTRGRNWHNPGFRQTDRDPVVCVNWHDAQAYARWMGQRTGRQYRLLTEAEWEYAARAGTQTLYWWGTYAVSPCVHANGADRTARTQGSVRANLTFADCSDGYAYTSPVGSFRANPFGLHDMGGNVRQWTEDCYVRSYVGASLDATVAVVSADCWSHVLRGGSWNLSSTLLDAGRRGWFETEIRSNDAGIRLARTPGG